MERWKNERGSRGGNHLKRLDVRLLLPSAPSPGGGPTGLHRTRFQKEKEKRSRKILRTSLYAQSFVSPFSAFPRATFLVSAFLNVRICANHSALTSRWRDGTGAEGA